MLIILCILILAYKMAGKDVSRLLRKVKRFEWKTTIIRLKETLYPHALKVGRTATRPLLQFYYVMSDKKCPTLDKALIYAALVYVISPVDILPRVVYRILGIVDDSLAMAYVYKKVKSKITPQINSRVDDTLNEWFGVEYTVVE